MFYGVWGGLYGCNIPRSLFRRLNVSQRGDIRYSCFVDAILIIRSRPPRLRLLSSNYMCVIRGYYGSKRVVAQVRPKQVLKGVVLQKLQLVCCLSIDLRGSSQCWPCKSPLGLALPAVESSVQSLILLYQVMAGAHMEEDLTLSCFSPTGTSRPRHV